MARKKATTKEKTKPSFHFQSNELSNRVLAVLFLFVIIVTVSSLGTVGKYLNSFGYYIFGIFGSIIATGLSIICFYVIYNGYMPSLKGHKTIGAFLVILAIFIAFSAPLDKSIVGFDVLNRYTSHTEILNGGIVGGLLYSLFSLLFDYVGTLIFSGIIGLIGICLVIGRSYFELKKEEFKEISKEAKENKKAKAAAKAIPVRDHNASKQKKISKLLFEPEPDEPKPVSSTQRRSKLLFDQDDEMPVKKRRISNPFEKEPEIELIDMPKTKRVNSKQEPVIHEHIFEVEEKPVIKKQTKKQEEVKEEVVEDIHVDTNVVVSDSYQLPPLSILNPVIVTRKQNVAQQLARENAIKLTNVLNEFGVHTQVTEIYIGPAVTKYELKLETGTRVNRISSLQDDIKLALAAKDIRIEAPIPGKAAVGVEIPNLESQTVSFRETLSQIPDKKKDSKLLVPLGKDVMGMTVFAELDKMPHLLIAGATGSGKSVCVNGIICSLLMRAKPDEVRLMLVDPKKVELSNYNGIPHLLTPVITDPKKASKALRVIVEEMERRYELFATYNVKNIAGYNEFAKMHNSSLDENEERKEILPFIVVILDEVADLMMIASKDVEDCIMRISQMARAAGIHLIVATQRPSTDVITGVVKANIPSRIAFAVSSSIDSRTILDMAGAEKLLGKGDMLFSPMGSNAPVRVQGSYVSDNEVQAIVDFVSKQQKAVFDSSFDNLEQASTSAGGYDEFDEEYEECRDFVIKSQKASASLLQRQFRIGYNKAARIIDQLEANGVIGPQIGSKPREVFIRGYEEEDF